MNPRAVSAMRILTGGGYYLVERYNNIVLEYRKKGIIRLRMTDLVTGHAGEQKPLGVSMTSTHELSHTYWGISALTVAGSKVVQSGGDYAVVLPASQPARKG